MATVAITVAAGFIWAAAPSQAVHDNGMFELDGNIVHNAVTNPPYDWASLFDANGNRLITPDPDNGPLLASIFVKDSAVPDPSYFQSNKDIEPIASWGCAPINNPGDKEDIQNTYAALVQVPANAPDNAGHTVLYIGSERDTANGTAFAGFWLLKDPTVGCTGTSTFTGHHTDGDLLIVSDYTNGGGAQDVSVYRWTGNDATGSPVLVPSFNGAICGGAANDNACAIANSATITSPWAPTSHVKNTFVEAGIDLTALLGAAGGCFTTFLSETRSSDQLNATLKDFAGGQFNTCAQPPIVTTANPGGTLNAPGTTQHDDATISAVGNRPAPTGTISFFLCNPAQVTAAGCPTGGTQIGGAVPIVGGAASSANVSGATTTTLGKYCWRAQYTPDVPSSGVYLPSSHTNATTECFTVVHGAPTISTQIAVTGANAPGLGFTTLGDTATLTGAVGNTNGETITFNLYGPYVNVTPTCTGQPIFTTTGQLNGGSATTSQTYQPTAAGTYVWVASYPGDTLNSGATGLCTDANESVTVVGAHIDVAKAAVPSGPVSAGDTIGFDITVSNSGTVPALNTVVTDNLPAGAGGDLNWSLTPAYPGCSISGAVGSQVLTCNLGTINHTPPPVATIHLTSPTTAADCGVVSNKATVATSNGTGGDSDTATVTIRCANLSLVKTADAASVDAEDQIGFTITASNSNAAGTGTAHNVTINDPLPSGTGIDWSIQSGPPNCSIQGSPPTETLVCTQVDLAPGASLSVHLVSDTAFASCKAYPNTATLNATNHASLQANATTTVRCPNLSLTKTADATPVDAGSPIGFTITASNSNAAGTGTAHDVVINDPLPSGPGIDWSIQSGPPNCSIQGSPPTETLVCTAVDLAPGGSETVHLISQTSFASCATLPNTATLNSTNHPSLTASDSIRVACASLTLSKTEDAPTVNAGEQIGFIITATNSAAPGTGTATGVVLNDPLPGGPGINWSILTGPPNCSIQGSPQTETLVCTSVSLAPGASFSVHVISNTSFASCAALPNTATLTSLNHPTVTASATTTVQCPNVSLTKTADDATVSAGAPIGFTVSVSNAGPGTATTVSLNDPLPAGGGINWSISPAYAGPGTCTVTGAVGSQVLSCAFGDLASGASASVHVTSQTSQLSCQAYPNTASLNSTNHPSLQANASTTVQCPDVDLTKTADDATVNAGSQIGFTITASNSNAAGTGTATNVVINDPLPGGTGIDWSIQSGPNNCSIQGSPQNETLVCTSFSLAPGASLTVHVVSGTSFASCALLPNVVTLTGLNVPTIQAGDATTVQCPNLSMTKTPDASPVSAGTAIGFTVTVSNSNVAGTGTAVNVVINDPLPGGSGIDWSIQSGPNNCSIQGSPQAETLVCTSFSLAPGASLTVHVISQTAFASCATYPNTASLTALNHPSLTANASVTVQCPNLTLTKDPDASTVNAGTQIGFTVTVSNSNAVGTGTATNIVINDPLPAGPGISWSIQSQSGNTCSIQGSPPAAQTLVCTSFNLLAGASMTVHIVSQTGFASCATYPNTASLTAFNHPALTASNSTTVQCPNLSITKTADDDTVSAGSTIGFTVSVANAGPGTATTVSVSDPLPAGSGVDWSISPAYAGPGTCSVTGAVGSQVLNCAFGNLASGASVSVHVQSGTAFASCGTYPNAATLNSTNHPSLLANDSTTVQCASLSISKTADDPTVSAGSPIGFTVSVANAGPGTATTVSVSDPLPAGSGINWSISPAYAGPGTCSVTGAVGSQVLNCAFGNLASGASASVHVVSNTAFVSCGTYPNAATLNSTNHPSLLANASTTVQCPNVSITKTADDPTVNAGADIGFTITVSNSNAAGTGTATGVAINDPLPGGPGIDWSIQSQSGSNCSIQGSPQTETLVCTAVNLAPGESLTVHVTSDTAFASCAVLQNQATATGTNFAQVQASDSTTVLCPSLSILKQADDPTVDAGSPIGFTITASNGGPGLATDVVINDPLPGGPGIDWSIESQSGNNCSIQGSPQNETLVCTAVNLASGASETVHVVSNTLFVSCAAYPNTATLTSTNSPSPNPANATTTVQCPNLTLGKSSDAPTVSAGTQIGFTITVSNSNALGTGTAEDVVISDALPTGPGLSWSIESQSGSTCSIQGSSPAPQTLNCTAFDLAPGASMTVHVVSNTGFASCATYPNTAGLSAFNHPALQANASTTVQCPALTLGKTADAATVSANSQIGFTVTVSNSNAAGTGTATGVAINDPLPGGSGVDWSIESQSGNNCSIQGSPPTETLVCTGITLTPGQSYSVHVISGTAFASCATYPNLASLTSTNHPSLTANASTTVQCPDVSITKTADDDTVNAGEDIGFTITVSNSNAAGTGTAIGVAVNDPLPGGPGIDWSIQSQSGNNCSIQGSPQTETLVCTAVNLAPGASLTVHVTSDTTFASCAQLTNVATVTGTNFPQDQASDSTTVQCPSITFGKTADAPTVDAGSPIGFTVTVSNGGPGVAKDVAINDPLPGGPGINWSIESQSGSNCSIQGSPQNETLVCTAVDLASGASLTVHVISDTAFASCATYDNAASLTASNAPSPADAEASTTVECPDLTLGKTADAATVDAGAQIGFTITVSNSDADGTGTAHDVVIDDPLPSGTGISWTIESGPDNCSISTNQQTGAQTLHCTAVDLGPDEGFSVHIVSETAFASCAAYPNAASLTAFNHPALQANATTTVQCADLTLTKTADDDTVVPGEPIGFSITVANSNASGTGTANGVVIDDPLPTGVGVTWSIESGPAECSILTDQQTGAQTLHCDAINLAAGESYTVHVTSTTTVASCTVYPNKVSLTALNHPSLDADATTEVQCPDPSIIKEADSETVNAGEQIGFTITASNGAAEGTGTATDVEINDPLPAGAGIDWSIESGPDNCSIEGSAPEQTLVCTPVDLDPGESFSVHVVSDTSPDSCGIYDNTATLTLSDGNAPDPASASSTIQCPALGLAKLADADSVRAGNQIGFLLTVTNDGPGAALGATLFDPLPTGRGVFWSIDQSATSALGCTIVESEDGQVLTCALGDLAAGASVTVHVVSDTADTSCARYPNVATLDADNAEELTADADTRVTDCLGIVPTSSSPGPVAQTGAGPIGFEIELALLMLLGGVALILGARRRKRGRHI